MTLSGTLHVGDEIREINGISVANQTVEQLQKMLVSLSAICVRKARAAGVCLRLTPISARFLSAPNI